MKQNIGFTLIEMMIVVCIVGIIAAVTISAYQTHQCEKQGRTDCSGKKYHPQQDQNVICISGYKFLSGSNTQILNATGGGIPCNNFN